MMIDKILKTEDLWSAMVLRTLFGIVLFAHGAQKLFGWFGGGGFQASMEYLMSSAGLPWIIGLLTILLESIGAIALFLGIGTRIIAMSFTGLGLGIVLTTHLQYGFFMNWSGNQTGEGIEYFIFWLAITLALTCIGGGKYSIDQYLYNQLNKNVVK